MPNDIGGITAISGFLFQVMVAAGLKASAEITGTSNDGTELGGLLRLASTANLLVEAYDQDVVLKSAIAGSKTGTSFIQVKYSKNGTSIGPQEMKDDIYPAFQRAHTAAIQANETCVGFHLVTNRTISAKLTSKLSKEAKELLQELKTYEKYDFNLWESYAIRFAQEYGLKPDEIEKGIHAFLGRIQVLTTQNGGNYEVTETDLIKTLAGNEHATGLVRRKSIEKSRINIKAFDGATKGDPVSRATLKLAMPEMENRALIVFEGLGGTGKTSALREWARSIAVDGAPSLPIVNMLNADDLTDRWIPGLVSELNPFLTPHDDLDAIERFGIANPLNVPPLLHLGLDGIDDQLNDAKAVKRFVRKFIQTDKGVKEGTSPLTCRLVVTCRSFDGFCRDMRLSPSGSDDDELKKHVLRIPFGYFTEDELKKLILQNCKDLLPRIFPSTPVFGSDMRYGSFAYSGSMGWNRSAVGGDVDVESFQRLDPAVVVPADKKFVKTLCDPVMWRGFVGLSPAKREAWLAGDEQIEREMADRYISRFINKARDRLGLEVSVLRQCLREVSIQAGTLQRFFSRTEWITWACQTNLMDSSDASKLYEEAASGGLIFRDSEIKWQWRNELVTNRLKSGDAS